MHIKINNKTKQDLNALIGYARDLSEYSRSKLGFNRPPVINLLSDQENANKTLGKTGFYSPDTMEIGIYVDGRHPKDILRSLSHELVHHTQNCNGEFAKGDSTVGETGEGYAQTNKHLRGLEGKAYLFGNGYIFRDWEDGLKSTNYNNNNINIKESKDMKISELRNAIREAIQDELSEGRPEGGDEYSISSDAVENLSAEDLALKMQELINAFVSKTGMETIVGTGREGEAPADEFEQDISDLAKDEPEEPALQESTRNKRRVWKGELEAAEQAKVQAAADEVTASAALEIKRETARKTRLAATTAAKKAKAAAEVKAAAVAKAEAEAKAVAETDSPAPLTESKEKNLDNDEWYGTNLYGRLLEKYTKE